MELDALDRLAATAFDGYIVRKDLAYRFRGRYPVPTYVGEFLLGRYCATTDEQEIEEELEIVERQMRERTVRSGEAIEMKSLHQCGQISGHSHVLSPFVVSSESADFSSPQDIFQESAGLFAQRERLSLARRA